MTKVRPIEIEAQLTYATALLAGCLYLFYELFTFSKETGWEGIFQLMIAIMAMIGLQFVVLGMSLHIYFRGHWMAQAMVERWKAKRLKERTEERRVGDGAGDDVEGSQAVDDTESAHEAKNETKDEYETKDDNETKMITKRKMITNRKRRVKRERAREKASV